MFEIGERIIYGTNGVCDVVEITSSPFDKNDDRSYYVLSPVFDTANLRIYSPADNPNVVMRPVYDRPTLEGIIAGADSIRTIRVDNEKRRRDAYRSVIERADAKGFISIIKTIAIRKTEFRKNRRRLPDLDSDFDHMARNCLYGELAVVLGIDRDEARSIVERITEPKTE